MMDYTVEYVQELLMKNGELEANNEQLKEELEHLRPNIKALHIRVRGRMMMNSLTADVHPESDARSGAKIRSDAYKTVMGDLDEFLHDYLPVDKKSV